MQENFFTTVAVNCRNSFKKNVHILTYSYTDANPKNFHCKQFQSVKMLQIEFDTMDFTHFYDLYRWNFLSSQLKKWCHFRTILDMQLHGCSNLAHSHCYNSDNGSFRDCVVSHCGNCVYHTFYLISFSTFSLLILLCCISCE